MCVGAKSLQSCLTLCDPVDYSLPGSSPWAPPGRNAGAGCHALLQGIFRTRGWNLSLLIFHMGRRFLNAEPPEKPQTSTATLEITVINLFNGILGSIKNTQCRPIAESTILKRKKVKLQKTMLYNSILMKFKDKKYKPIYHLGTHT